MVQPKMSYTIQDLLMGSENVPGGAQTIRPSSKNGELMPVPALSIP